MRNIPALCRIKLKNLLCDRLSLAMLLLLPFFAIGCVWATTVFYLEGGKQIPVGLLDLDQTPFSRSVSERFSRNVSVDVRALDGATVQDASAFVRNGALEAVVVIRPGFAEKLRRAAPEGLLEIVSAPSSIARGLVTELFVAQVARIYFNCDAAAAAVAEAVRTRADPPFTEAQKESLWAEAYATADAYWEPQPLMTIQYERWINETAVPPAKAGEDSAAPAPAPPASAAENTRNLLNGLIVRGIGILFFLYAAFCLMIVSGSVIRERENGILLRLQSGVSGTRAWMLASALVPFALYGVPCAILYPILFQPQTEPFASAVLTFAVTAPALSAVFFLYAALGVWLARRAKSPLRFQLLTLAILAVSAALRLWTPW
jgi:ABC-type Na+ efflux pump permease subunit